MLGDLPLTVTRALQYKPDQNIGFVNRRRGCYEHRRRAARAW